MADDDGLVDDGHLLSLVGLAGEGFGEDGLFIVNVQQVLSVFLLQSSQGGVAVPLQDVGLGWFEFLRNTINTEQVVVGSNVLHLFFSWTEDDALTDIIRVLLQEGFLLLQLQGTTLRKIRISILNRGHLTITTAAQSQQGLGCILLSQPGASQLDIQGVSETVLETVSHTLVHLAPSATP